MSIRLLALVGISLLMSAAPAGRGQSKQSSTGRRGYEKRDQSLVRLSARSGPDASEVLARVDGEVAMSRNSQLMTDLPWVFGGKTQRGWQLYAPLIAEMLGVDSDPASEGFVVSLAHWQWERGIPVTGILDGATWGEMVASFQLARLRDKKDPSPDRVIVIPPSDCYDPTRSEEFRLAEGETYAAYKKMVRAAAADKTLGLAVSSEGDLAESERYLKIISALRTREYQASLRKQSPRSGRAGLAVNSPHFTGRALDLYVGGEPVSTRDDNRALQIRTPVYRWLVKNASSFGFRPYFYEPWHWEHVGSQQ
jgi:LAS superfamily LD-carboxypeptidase LdcB